MEQLLSEISFHTNGEGFIDITPDINHWIKENNFKKGILVISSKHTSCSLTINENADPDVLKDLSAYLKSIVPEEGLVSLSGNKGKYKYRHSQEGADDMPAHIRTALTSSSLSLSIDQSRLVLGTWQAIYLWEHRYKKQLRKLNFHAIGDIHKIKANKEEVDLNSLIKRRNASKINKAVIRNYNSDSHIQGDSPDTNLDLLIDRIHDLTTENE